MAVTADQVEVRLRADTAQYVRNLNQADAAFTNTANGIVASSARANAATNNLALNTGNIAAQFQDIGVTAAAGMNPLIIALQQGTQLSAVLNESVGRGVSPVKALGAAFLQVINPISLATIAAVALGAALLQGLGAVVPKTESANEALKRHREELEKVVRGYGDAEDAVDEYFDGLERLPQFAVSEGIAKGFDELGETAERFRTRLASLEVFLNDSESGLGSLGDETGKLVTQFNAGEISSEEFYLALGEIQSRIPALEAFLGSLGGGIGAIVTELREGTVALEQFGNAAQRALAASFADLGTAVDTDLQSALDLRTYIAEQERINGLTNDQLMLEREIARIKADQPAITDSAALELAERTLAAEKARADLKKSGATSSRDYERERQEITDLLAAMGLEAALLGQTNREKAIAIALSKANATATQEELDLIQKQAGFIYDTEQALKNLNETSTEWANTIQSATRGFIDDLIEGKSAAEAFSNVLSNIANKLLDVGLGNLFGGSGLNLSGLFGGTATRANGGSVYAGVPVQVNERGQEMFIPTQPGRIVPASQVGGGGSVTFAPVIDARGADVAAVARLEGVVQRLAADVVPAIRREMATAGKKGR